MNCAPLRALTLRSPCADPRSNSCAPVEAMCLRTGTASTSVGAESASGCPSLEVATPVLGGAEMGGSDFSPPSLAVRLTALPSFVVWSAPANASVENAIRLTPAATEDNLSMRFTLHVIDERRYGEPARTRNSLDHPAFRRALAKPSSLSRAAASASKSRR